MSNAAVFLDRDGTINVEKNYLHRYEDWEWIPGAVEAIREFNEKGFLVIVISNQAGIARGLYSVSDLSVLHENVDNELCRLGARIDAYYYCPHHPDFGHTVACACRKPAPGLLLRARADWGLDLTRSFMIGDKAEDVKAGEAVGVRSILVSTGYGSMHRHLVGSETPYASDLLEASLFIENNRL